MTVEEIASICHDANARLCAINGDPVLSWYDAGVRESAIRGVEFVRDHPTSTPGQQHEAWMADKMSQGWVYGKRKSLVDKTHPCLVPYAELPVAQQAKDELFQAICRALLPLVTEV